MVTEVTKAKREDYSHLYRDVHDDGGRSSGSDTDDDDDFADELEAEMLRKGNKRKFGNDDNDGDEGADDEDDVRVHKAARPTTNEHERRHQQHDGAPGLASLPFEMVMQVLRWLSPEDLTVLAVTCRALRGPTKDHSLWRRCYCARFGHPKQREEQTRRGRLGGSSGGMRSGRGGSLSGGAGPGPGSSGLGGCSWRALYFHDDARELRQAVVNAPMELRPIYAQMQAAKRSQAPDPIALHGDDVLLTLTDAESVGRWRASKGLGDGTEQSSRRHTCSIGHGCAFHRIGADIFVCETTGRAHVCDDECRERVVDMDGMSETCAISGRSFDRILDEGAEEMIGGYGAETVGAGGGCDPTGERGWLRGCYEAGYGASSEKEMYAALWGGDGSAGVRANEGGDSEDDADSSDSSDSELD